MPGLGALAQSLLRFELRRRHELRARAFAGRRAQLAVSRSFLRRAGGRRRRCLFSWWHAPEFMSNRSQRRVSSRRVACKQHDHTMPVIVILADGARVDTLAAALDSGAFPALARLRGD